MEIPALKFFDFSMFDDGTPISYAPGDFGAEFL
jgi:hypothetical protein